MIDLDVVNGNQNATLNVDPGASIPMEVVPAGHGGTDDYNDLSNKPSINNVTLIGNKSLTDIGAYQKPSGGIPASDLAAGVIPSVPVQDVQVNGVSVLNNGVAKVPVADGNTIGVIAIGQGLKINAGNSKVNISSASEAVIKTGINGYQPIVPANQHTSVFYGLAKAAGDSTQSASSNAVGTYTEAAKSAISQMLDAPESVSGSTPSIAAQAGVRYICGECATLGITLPASGIVDVVFTSGSTPTVLTVTPPTGMTMKWANGFDPTSLDANTTYEINIMDGVYGVVGSWT